MENIQNLLFYPFTGLFLYIFFSSFFECSSYVVLRAYYVIIIWMSEIVYTSCSAIWIYTVK